VALQSGEFLIQLVESDCDPGEETRLESIIRTQRSADDLQLIGLAG
jgi:hypothetical protein